MSSEGQDKIYSIITDRIISELEKGVIPWKKPWDSSFSIPANFKSKKSYRGSNVLMLLSAGFPSKYWMTFKQAKELGGAIKAGEKGTPVTYWNFTSPDSSELEKKRRAFLRYYTVFNFSQCEGISPPEETKSTFTPIALAEDIVKNYPSPAPLIIQGDFAGYSKSLDTVAIPPMNSFIVHEEFYSTLFHELVHSTGHCSRLSRDLSVGRKSDSYSVEELIAEFGAAFLCARVGISNTTCENQISYISHWKEVLRNNNKLLLQAAGKAQLAVDFITKETHEKE